MFELFFFVSVGKKARSASCLVIAHRLSTVMDADKIVVLEKVGKSTSIRWEFQDPIDWRYSTYHI